MGSRVDEKPTVYNTLAQNHNFLKCASACILCACLHMIVSVYTCVYGVCGVCMVCVVCVWWVCVCGVYRVPEDCSELQQSILKVTVYINMLISTTNY